MNIRKHRQITVLAFAWKVTRGPAAFFPVMNPTRLSNIRSKSSIATKRQHINTRKSSKLMYEACSGLLKATDEDQKCSPLLEMGTSGTSSEASTKSEVHMALGEAFQQLTQEFVYIIYILGLCDCDEVPCMKP